jgi:hypothetical protein
MPRLFYLHWNAAELEPRVRDLEAAGHAVVSHCTPGEPPRLGESLPDAVIISLDRLPSHGRHVAAWFWEAKRRRSIPILFVGGKPHKVAEARAQFPEAVFCADEAVTEKLAELLAAAPAAADAA